ncbi:hypothetical protein MUK42_18200 [Musa troglodytarum]|uniref:Multiprotein bridging factor 1 N-terminal domain-containing protein n=1 Tax=Musa troglodytarum TaxID=320322 RepID=A0A9E7L4L1_9LILI|nr:hypothetical protein MUK42_18200 [Musa troglodytarum]
MAGNGPITQDWEPIVIRKKAPTAAAKKDEKAVNAARRSGAEIETVKKSSAGTNKAASSSTSLNTRKLDEETENLTHERVSSELKKNIMQARLGKKLTQAQLGQMFNVVGCPIHRRNEMVHVIHPDIWAWQRIVPDTNGHGSQLNSRLCGIDSSRASTFQPFLVFHRTSSGILHVRMHRARSLGFQQANVHRPIPTPASINTPSPIDVGTLHGGGSWKPYVALDAKLRKIQDQSSSSGELDPADLRRDDKVRVVQALLFATGINTLLQTLFGNQATNYKVSAHHESHTRSLMVSSSIQIILGYSQLWGKIFQILQPTGNGASGCASRSSTPETSSNEWIVDTIMDCSSNKKRSGGAMCGGTDEQQPISQSFSPSNALSNPTQLASSIRSIYKLEDGPY